MVKTPNRPPKAKTRAANLAVPQSANEACDYIARIGLAARIVARIEHDMNDQIAAIKQASEQAASAYTAEIKALTEGLRIFCDAHRNELTASGKVKYHQFGTGKIEWRILPPKVSLRGVKAEDVVAWCEAQPDGQYLGFVRVKKEIDKDAMLAAPGKATNIPGVSIGSAGEDFTVTPFEAQLSGAAVARAGDVEGGR